MVKITLNECRTPPIRRGIFSRAVFIGNFASICGVSSRAEFNWVNRVKAYLGNVSCAKVELMHKMISELKTWSQLYSKNKTTATTNKNSQPKKNHEPPPESWLDMPATLLPCLLEYPFIGLIAPFMGIRIPESGKFLLVGSWILGFGIRIQHKESGIPLKIGIQNPGSTEQDWNPESRFHRKRLESRIQVLQKKTGIQNPEFGSHGKESIIQDCHVVSLTGNLTCFPRWKVCRWVHDDLFHVQTELPSRSDCQTDRWDIPRWRRQRNLETLHGLYH